MASSNNTWPEIITVQTENRHELVLSGAEISNRIKEQDGVDPKLYDLVGLNYLNISDTCLSSVDTRLSKLKNLTTLVLHTNKLAEIPDCIGDLEKLKMLDVSRNQLKKIPEQIQKLPQLSSLNLSSNQLSAIPALQHNTKLASLDLSLNNLEDFPDICYPELAHLSELKLQGNKIKMIPHTIGVLVSLKSADFSDNCIGAVPAELADISKLKDISLQGNKLSDNRLKKLVEQCKPKQVLDYVRQHGTREKGGASGGGGGGGKKGKKGKNKPVEPETEEVISKLTHKMKVLHVTESVPDVIAEEESIKLVRPHIVCCVVRGVKFTANSLRSFIQLQTRLHDTICEKRQLATIATHDLAALKNTPLHYVARPPNRLKLVPLGQEEEITAADLMKILQEEADEDRRSHSSSGVHRYLSFLEGKPVYPCVKTHKGRVISLPPITNAESTKITEATENVFIEVTSAHSQGACKKVLHELLFEMLELGLGDEADSVGDMHSLTIEQVKVLHPDGTLKVVYPSRVDLAFEETKNITVIRD